MVKSQVKQNKPKYKWEELLLFLIFSLALIEHCHNIKTMRPFQICCDPKMDVKAESKESSSGGACLVTGSGIESFERLSRTKN